MREHLNKGPRPEFQERDLDSKSLHLKWENVIKSVSKALDEAETTDNFIDIVKTCNLRGGLANRRELDDWEYRWYGLKYQTLIKALEKRQMNEINLLIGAELIEDKNYLAMIFKGEGAPYKTVTQFNNLYQKSSQQEITSLVNPFNRKKAVEPRFSLIKQDEDIGRSLILGRNLGAGFIMEDYAYITVHSGSSDTETISMVALKSGVVVSNPEMHEMDTGKTYALNDIDCKIKAVKPRYGITEYYIKAPRSLKIVRDEIHCLSQLRGRYRGPRIENKQG